ncbi:hypothetical protein QQ045_013206 [Rhodiola kirilowii]
MVQSSAILAFILAQIFLLMITVQASVMITSDQQLSALSFRGEILRIETAAEPYSSGSDQPHLSTEGEEEGGGFDAEPPAIRRLGKHKGRDPSVAGGEVILGGLALAAFAAVLSYIRVTRKRTSVIL